MMLLHTMLRVGDLQRSVDYYTRVIGMEHLRTVERPTENYTLAFVAFDGGNKNGGAELETHLQPRRVGVRSGKPPTDTSRSVSMTSWQRANESGRPVARLRESRVR